MTEFMYPRESRAVESMIAAGQLSRVSADPQLADAILERAGGRLRSAKRAFADNDLTECASPLWDAVRLACTAILQAEGLRTHGEGHHGAVLTAVTEQYGHLLAGGLRSGRRLREARRESQYPVLIETEPVDPGEVEDDIDTVKRLLEAVERLLPNIPVYRG